MLNVDCSCSWTAWLAVTPQHLATQIVQHLKELVACNVSLDCRNLVFLTLRSECNDLDMLDNCRVSNTQLLQVCHGFCLKMLVIIHKRVPTVQVILIF
jgi:hypothetical protein